MCLPFPNGANACVFTSSTSSTTEDKGGSVSNTRRHKITTILAMQKLNFI